MAFFCFILFLVRRNLATDKCKISEFGSALRDNALVSFMGYLCEHKLKSWLLEWKYKNS
jgi:hypothetical protein